MINSIEGLSTEAWASGGTVEFRADLPKRIKKWMLLPIVALAFALLSPPEASASGDACAARRLLEAANFSSCRLKAASKAAKVGSGIKDEKCDRVLRKKEHVVAQDCSSTPAPSLTDLRDFLSEATSDVVAAVHGGDSSMLGDSDAEPAEPDNVFGVLVFTSTPTLATRLGSEQTDLREFRSEEVLDVRAVDVTKTNTNLFP